MDISNEPSRRRFEEVDELLAFVSIYDDHRRMRALEGGCGLGALSIEMAKLGARKVYAIEQKVPSGRAGCTCEL